MFNSDPNKVFVPSKTVIVKPENQTDYKTRINNQIRFHIPSYIGFCDPQHLRFQCKAKMICVDGGNQAQNEPRGIIHPDGAAGIWSTIRDLRVSDGTGRTELEMISDLNVLCANEWGFTQNDSINGKRELFEGMSMNSNNKDQLWYDSTGTNWTATAQTTNGLPKQNKISARIPCSGIIGTKATNVFPLTATSGLRVVMNIEEIKRSMTLSSNTGAGQERFYSGPAGEAGTTPYAEQNGAKQVVPPEFYALYTTKGVDASNSDVVETGDATKNNGEFTLEICLVTDRANMKTDLQENAVVDSRVDNNFAIGDLMYVCQDKGEFPNCLGKITKMEKDATGGRLKITYQANRPNGDGLDTGTGVNAGGGYIGGDNGTAGTGTGVVFFLPENRVDQIQLFHTKKARDTGETDVLPALELELSDCELSILQVEPPAGYVDNMLKKVNGSGVEMDYCTTTLYRGNIVNAQGMTSNLIPANESRAYSILSVPLTQASQSLLHRSSLLARYESQKSYQWVMNGALIPDRPISLEKYKYERNPVLHIMENEKAVGNAKNTVRNLWNTNDRLLLGRALSRYGQVHDLQGKTTMLRVTYPNTVGDTVLLNNNIVHLNRMIIQADGVVVIR